MQIGDIIEPSPATWNPKVLPVEFTWDPNKKKKRVGIITGLTEVTDDGPMILIGYVIEWANGETSVETGFTIRKVGQ